MTKEEKMQTAALRGQGLGYKKIADIVGVTKDMVRSYCRTQKLEAAGTNDVSVIEKMKNGSACLFCGKEIVTGGKGRRRKFCSEECRRAYWKKHVDEKQKRPSALYVKMCPYCGKTFEVYGDMNRKYCCHEHYVLDRYGEKTS